MANFVFSVISCDFENHDVYCLAQAFLPPFVALGYFATHACSAAVGCIGVDCPSACDLRDFTYTAHARFPNGAVAP